MVEIRWFESSLFLILVLQFTAAGQDSSSVTVRVRDDVTLSCGRVREDQVKCDGTTWIFGGSGRKDTVPLFELGKIHKEARSKSDRLSLTEKCSLVVKKVSAEDAGLYTCRQFDKSGRQQGSVSLVDLSVVTITEQKDGDEVTLTCSVSMYGDCRQSVKWLYQGRDVDKGHSDLLTSQSLCSVSVSFQTSHFIYGSRYKIFSCNVTDGLNKQQLTFPIQASPEESGEDETIATKTSMKADWLWLCLIVVVALVAVLMLVVIRWKRTKGKDDNEGLTSNPTVTQSAPETSQDTAYPQEGVSYASISYTKKTDSRAQVGSKNDDHENDVVTYSTVRTPSAEPNSLYTSIT